MTKTIIEDGILRVDYLSDLHIRHHIKPEPKNLFVYKITARQIEKFVESLIPSVDERGDVIAVAGDISEDINETYTVLATLAKNYHKVFFVFGNHDRYLLQEDKFNGIFGPVQKMKKLVDMCSRRKATKGIVEILWNKTTVFKNITFGGTSLWYNVTDKEARESNNNDVVYIRDSLGRILNKQFHNEDMKFYHNMDFVDVLITHVPPCSSPFSKYPFSPFFQTPVSKYKAKYWIVGHVHERGSWGNTEETTFFNNSLGYKFKNGEMEIPEEFKMQQIKIEHFEACPLQ